MLKIDDVNNTGSLKLRVRSLVESLRTKTGDEELQERHRFIATLYGETCRAENHCALLHAIHIPVDTVPDETGGIQCGKPSDERQRVLRLGTEILEQ